MLKVSVIGCGMISDQHVDSIQNVEGSKIVAACDREPLMAKQLADRFSIPAYYDDAVEMLEKEEPDVVHITTTAQSHYPLGKLCLEAGCHVYMEKPFTETAAQTAELIALAESKGLKMTVGHNLQYSPEAIEMRHLIKSGFLDGPPIHIECSQMFPHDESSYGKALLGDSNHWVRTLPGSLPHNLISHGIAKFAEFIDDEKPEIIAHTFTSPFLHEIGQPDIVDEIRAIIFCKNNLTINFVFSTQLAACDNKMTIYSKNATISVDSTNRITTGYRLKGYKSFLRYFLMPLAYAKLLRKNSWRNIKRFLKSEFHMGYGMREMTRLFYQSIKTNSPLPISYKEIQITANIMDSIFSQYPDRQTREHPAAHSV